MSRRRILLSAVLGLIVPLLVLVLVTGIPDLEADFGSPEAVGFTLLLVAGLPSGLIAAEHVVPVVRRISPRTRSALFRSEAAAYSVILPAALIFGASLAICYAGYGIGAAVGAPWAHPGTALAPLQIAAAVVLAHMLALVVSAAALLPIAVLTVNGVRSLARHPVDMGATVWAAIVLVGTVTLASAAIATFSSEDVAGGTRMGKLLAMIAAGVGIPVTGVAVRQEFLWLTRIGLVALVALLLLARRIRRGQGGERSEEGEARGTD